MSWSLFTICRKSPAVRAKVTRVLEQVALARNGAMAQDEAMLVPGANRSAATMTGSTSSDARNQPSAFCRREHASPAILLSCAHLSCTVRNALQFAHRSSTSSPRRLGPVACNRCGEGGDVRGPHADGEVTDGLVDYHLAARGGVGLTTVPT